MMVQNNCIVELQRDAYVKDLGVVFDEKLNYSQDISEIINKAYSMLWLIRRNFRDTGPEITFKIQLCLGTLGTLQEIGYR